MVVLLTREALASFTEESEEYPQVSHEVSCNWGLDSHEVAEKVATQKTPEKMVSVVTVPHSCGHHPMVTVPRSPMVTVPHSPMVTVPRSPVVTAPRSSVVTRE